jgi:8-oxo-dGTP pyrophosphatase MutT (NUDIX family)
VITTPVRHSLGVVCCRHGPNGRLEVLLVCKRFTYAFNMFAHGKYRSDDSAGLIELFNRMTVDEKLDILSLNFMQIWYRLWLNSIQRNSSYFRAKNMFESTFVADGGTRLRRLIERSTNAARIWEVPKGRKRNKAETDIQCAVREFGEETGVVKKSYRLLGGATRSYSYVDEGIRYTNTYYIAIARHHIDPRIVFGRHDQVNEIADIEWMDMDRVRVIDTTGRLVSFLRPVFHYVKKHSK